MTSLESTGASLRLALINLALEGFCGYLDNPFATSASAMIYTCSVALF